MRRNILLVSAIGAIVSVTLAGCDSKPTGQVVAIVNGEEISLPELNAELEALSVPANADKEKVRRLALQQIVDRRLIAQAAKEEGLDKDPAYVMRERRSDELLLVQMYGKKAADTIRVPGAPEIDKFIADNPTLFGQRTRYLVDQIQFQMPSDPASLKQLEGDHSLAEVAETLKAMGIKFEQGKNALDSGSVPPEVMKRILALPPGEPFIVPAGDRVVVSVITGNEPLTLPPEQVRPLAVQAIRNQSLGKLAQSRLKEAKAKAKIEYQPGYEPIKDGTQKPAAAAK